MRSGGTPRAAVRPVNGMRASEGSTRWRGGLVLGVLPLARLIPPAFLPLAAVRALSASRMAEARRCDPPPGRSPRPLEGYSPSRMRWRNRRAACSWPCTPGELLKSPAAPARRALRGYSRASRGRPAAANMVIPGRTVRRCRMRMNLSRLRRLATCAVLIVATAACGGEQQPHHAGQPNPSVPAAANFRMSRAPIRAR